MGTHYRGTAEETGALDAYIKLMRAALSVGTQVHRHLAREGITETQFGVLEALFHLGPLCQRDLAAKLLKSGANTTTVVDNLERRGLVRRERGAADRRYVAVQLTSEGRILIDRIFPRQVAAVVEAFGSLDLAEREELGLLCRKLGRGVGSAAAPRR